MEQQVLPEKRKKSTVGKIIRFFLYSGLLVLVLLFGLVAILFIYEKEVKAAILKELNHHLKVQVVVAPENIDLTIIKSFPECALQFKKVLVRETFPEKDSLLYAENLGLRFDISDLWNGKYNIHKIRIDDGLLNLKVLKNGNANYEFWDKSAGSDGTTEFDLNEIKVQNLDLRYLNREAKVDLGCLIKELQFSGHFGNSAYALKVKGELQARHLKISKSTYLKNRHVKLNLDFNVNNNDYEFNNAAVDINDLKLALSGKFTYSKQLDRFKLDFKVPDFKISEALSLVPKVYMPVNNDYESEGKFYVSGRYEFEFPKKFALDCKFGINNGIVTYKPNKISAKDVNFTGDLRYNQSSSKLVLNGLNLNLNGDLISGDFSMNDFSNPYLEFKADAKLKLENLLAFWPIDTLQELKGDLQAHSTVSGLLSDLKSQTFTSKVVMDLEASIKNLEVKFKHDDKRYFVENCDLTSRDREIRVRDLKLKRGTSDMELNGYIPGLFNYIIDKSAPLIIEGSLSSNNIDIEDFLFRAGKSGSNSALIPPNIRFKLDAKIGIFTFGKFSAQKITGDIEIRNQKAVINEVHLNAMGGEAMINVFVDASQNKIDMTLQSTVNQIDVNEMFKQMNNFGQNTLQDKHLRGLLTASVDFSGSWSNDLQVNEKSIIAQSNILIERGELIDFEPLLALSQFVSLDDLKRIKFSALQSNINISNRIITIPNTTIKNSALNIDVWGTHSFDNVIDYHVRLLTSELLSKKRKNKDSEFGPVENDPENRRMAFIRMKGPMEKLDIYYDRQGMKAKIKEDIQRERKTAKQIFKEEFGLFKKDTLAPEPVKKPKFEIDEPNNKPKKKPLELEKKDDGEDF